MDYLVYYELSNLISLFKKLIIEVLNILIQVKLVVSEIQTASEIHNYNETLRCMCDLGTMQGVANYY